MAKAPIVQPIIDIPGIENARSVVQQTRIDENGFAVRIVVDGLVVRLDPDSDWMDRDWFGLFVREMERRGWNYDFGGETRSYLWVKH